MELVTTLADYSVITVHVISMVITGAGRNDSSAPIRIQYHS